MLRSDLNDLEIDLHAMYFRWKQAAVDCEHLEDDNNGLRDKVDGLKTSLKEKRAEYNELKMQEEAARDEASHLASNLEALTLENEQLQKQMRAVKSTLKIPQTIPRGSTDRTSDQESNNDGQSTRSDMNDRMLLAHQDSDHVGEQNRHKRNTMIPN